MSSPSRLRLLPREVGGLRDLRRRRPDHDRDLRQVGQLDCRRIPGVGLSVDIEGDGLGAAEFPDARVGEGNAPFGEELAERIGLRGLRLRVDDPRSEVRVEGRYAWCGAPLDASIGNGTIGLVERAHVWMADVD